VPSGSLSPYCRRTGLRERRGSLPPWELWIPRWVRGGMGSVLVVLASTLPWSNRRSDRIEEDVLRGKGWRRASNRNLRMGWAFHKLVAP
jgi:hypothetical protein